MRNIRIAGIKKFLLSYICMPVFLACICFMLLYAIVCSQIGRPELYLETLRVALGGEKPFYDEFEDIFEPDNNDRTDHDNTIEHNGSSDQQNTDNSISPPFSDIRDETGEQNGNSSGDKNSESGGSNSEIDSETGEDDNTVRLSDIRYPHFNNIYGRFEIPGLDISYELIMGESELGISRGVCQTTDSYIPGYGGTIKLTIHNHKVRKVENIEIGEEIKLTTNYGVYLYRVETVSVVENTDTKAFEVYTDKNDLVFYTCYPLTRPSTTQRLVVRAVQISGPKIVKD